jgi:hypothetical protein
LFDEFDPFLESGNEAVIGELAASLLLFFEAAPPVIIIAPFAFRFRLLMLLMMRLPLLSAPDEDLESALARAGEAVDGRFDEVVAEEDGIADADPLRILARKS